MLTFEVNITVFLLFCFVFCRMMRSQRSAAQDLRYPQWCVTVLCSSCTFYPVVKYILHGSEKTCRRVIYKHVGLENTVNYVYNSHAQTKKKIPETTQSSAASDPSRDTFPLNGEMALSHGLYERNQGWGKSPGLQCFSEINSPRHLINPE